MFKYWKKNVCVCFFVTVANILYLAFSYELLRSVDLWIWLFVPTSPRDNANVMCTFLTMAVANMLWWPGKERYWPSALVRGAAGLHWVKSLVREWKGIWGQGRWGRVKLGGRRWVERCFRPIWRGSKGDSGCYWILSFLLSIRALYKSPWFYSCYLAGPPGLYTGKEIVGSLMETSSCFSGPAGYSCGSFSTAVPHGAGQA